MAGKKHALVLQHFKGNPPGRVGNLLEEYNIPYHLVQVGHSPLPNPSEYGAIFVLGGTQHLYDKASYPYATHEELYLKRAIEEHIPYLGMCLGGQLLANMFQAPIRKLPKELIGFLEIHFTEAGKQDPLYAGMGDQQLAFQWHEDAFELPHGAVELAHHESGANQAFLYLEHAYGLQYHVEITQEMFDVWLHEPDLKKEFIDAYGTERYQQTERATVERYPAYDRQARTLIENFLRISTIL